MEKIYKLLNSNNEDVEIGLHILIGKDFIFIKKFFEIYKVGGNEFYTEIKSNNKLESPYYVLLNNDWAILVGDVNIRLRNRYSSGYAAEWPKITKEKYLNGTR